MNKNRWLLASLAVFAVIGLLEALVHGFLLQDYYQETSYLWRPQMEMQRMVWLMWLGYALFAPVFVFIYTRGYESKKSGWGQGLRFGLAMAVVLSVMQTLAWYAILPIPFILAFYWLLSGMLQFTLAGIVAGLIYRP